MLVARDVTVSVEDGVVILGPVSLEVAPGSLVALMGPSGSGKSTLLQVVSGISQPTSGTVTWASEPTAANVQAFGYVPQRESVHDRLTTREALHYAASLRLDAGASIAQRVDEVLEELGLREQADTLIRNLSGGERRRAACGLELVGNPAVLLLDEPTSGLDTVLERRLMQLFRRQAQNGRVVLVATHATASLDLCDEVVVLQPGGPPFRGTPAQARAHLAAVAQTHQGPELAVVAGPQAGPTGASVSSTVPAPADRPFGLELRVLAGRYRRTLLRDRRTLAILLGQAPVLGVLIAVVFQSSGLQITSSPIDAIELVFLLMTGAIWLGLTSACREVVKERGLVEREFDVGVRLDAYIVAKAVVIFALNFVQVVLLTIVALTFRPLDIGLSGFVELLGIAVLTAWASAGLGLIVSCAARSVDQAAGAIPLLLMPQLLLAGGLVPLAAMPSFVSGVANVVYARWAYAGMASAAQMGARFNAYTYSSSLGYNNSFFALRPGAAVVILIAFTLGELLVAIFLLTRRPPVNP